MMRSLAVFLATAAALVASPAFAHPGHEHSGLVAGLMHPIGGADHLAAMLAVGLWAGLAGGRRRWVWPGAFVMAMVAGAVVGWSALPIPIVEVLIAASVVALGVSIALGWSPHLALGAAAVASFGALHGFAHGTEMPGDAFPTGYAAGFVTATALLHAAGLGLAVALAGLRSRAAPRVAGGALASLGLVLFAGSVAG